MLQLNYNDNLVKDSIFVEKLEKIKKKFTNVLILQLLYAILSQ